MTDQEEYADIVEALHDAALELEGADIFKVSALINVAVEAAFALYGPEEGRRLLVSILKRQLAEANKAGCGTGAGYYGPKN
jgi:hypothetical protein